MVLKFSTQLQLIYENFVYFSHLLLKVISGSAFVIYGIYFKYLSYHALRNAAGNVLSSSLLTPLDIFNIEGSINEASIGVIDHLFINWFLIRI